MGAVLLVDKGGLAADGSNPCTRSIATPMLMNAQADAQLAGATRKGRGGERPLARRNTLTRPGERQAGVQYRPSASPEIPHSSRKMSVTKNPERGSSRLLDSQAHKGIAVQTYRLNRWSATAGKTARSPRKRLYRNVGGS